MKTFKQIAEEYKGQLEEVVMSKANRSVQDKKLAKKKAQAKAKKKCSGNMTPSVKTMGNQVKVTCTPKDKTRARKQKKVAKSFKRNIKAVRDKQKKTAATRAFRK